VALLVLACSFAKQERGSGFGDGKHHGLWRRRWHISEATPLSLDARDPTYEGTNNESIQVGFVAAGNLQKYLETAALLMSNIDAVTNRSVHFHVFTDGSSAVVKNNLVGRPEGTYSVHEFRSMAGRDRRVYDGLASTVEGYLSEVATLYVYKLMLHRLVPSSLDKLILMDLDMFVISDLGGLWREFERFKQGQLLGMAMEQQPTYMGCWKSEKFTAEFGQHGFWGWNGGMQLLHLEHMRASAKYTKLLRDPSWFAKQKGKLASRCQEGQSWNLGDQDLYSIMAGGGFEAMFYTLPCRWNIQQCKYWQSQHSMSGE
jgi:hypothetical protein